MVGCALAVIRVGPGGRHCALGSLAWSTFLYLSAPWGVRMSCCPGSVSFEMSLMEPPNQTPVRSGWGPGGCGSPLYHHAPTAGLGFGGGAPRPCAAAGVVTSIKTKNTVTAKTIEISERWFIPYLLVAYKTSYAIYQRVRRTANGSRLRDWRAGEAPFRRGEFEIGRILRRPHDRLRDHLAPLTLLGLHRRTSGQ